MGHVGEGILCGTSAAYFESLQEGDGAAPEAAQQWREFFASAELAQVTSTAQGAAAAAGADSGGEYELCDPELDGGVFGSETIADDDTRDSVQAMMMIRAYRVRGHLLADLDPLELSKKDYYPELDPDRYGFTEQRREHPVYLAGVLGLQRATINEVLAILRRNYCGKIAYEFMHVSSPREKSWLQERIEGEGKDVTFTREGKLAILAKLTQAEAFEQTCHLKFTGTKRFGLDGAEAMVPALEQIIKRGGQLGLNEIVLGMPHRGRLNVLTAVMNKPYRAVFSEFQGGSSHGSDVEGSGDVKYHLGASSDREFDGNKVHLSLTANPSHLEIVDPVVLGKVRAKQDQLEDTKVRTSVLPLLLHGDAAFAGQGVVAECFGLSGLRGHRVGGSVHFIVNNQIGFTTNPRYSRSSPYPSDVAKMVEAPIIHVNGDDPEAAVYAAKVAIEFRQEFGKPVVVDMFCYRRFGHNEGDEPAFTQPIMYSKIGKHDSVVDIYGRRLEQEGVIAAGELEQMRRVAREHLEVEFVAANSYTPDKADWFDGKWQGLRSVKQDDEASETSDRRGDTAVPEEKLLELSAVIHAEPQNIEVHRTLKRVLKRRRDSVLSGEGIDWATAESLAIASLLDEGTRVRLSGQDSERGTFSQRHAVVYDQNDETRLVPLDAIAAKSNTRFEVINSMLSEEAVLGFEYGYSLAEPDALTIWEAQFGDFANGAQVVIDQFISSGQHKWLRNSGLVLLLPHGYEGQGPEHSSARLERYLQSCAEDNMQVANCTTPANYFHILRRQMRRQFRVPLVLMTPKSLLRHRLCVSSLSYMGAGSVFHRLLWDDAEGEGGLRLGEKTCPPQKVRRVLLCSGKVYYDLFAAREEQGVEDVYIMRLEQIYPFPDAPLQTELARFPSAEVVWVQEEPENMGGWSFVEPRLAAVIGELRGAGGRARYVGRSASAATATGSSVTHNAELRALLAEAFA